jgi:nanoRNase/pAp phosphatase (c-di-AMP/oligoRNAs hydrolase)
MKSSRRLLNFLSKRGKKLSPLLILTHDYPDPDAIATAWSLKYIAKKFFAIRSKIVYSGMMIRIENRHMVMRLKIPLHRLNAVELRKYAHVALVDTQPQFANNPFPSNERAAVVIDQHHYGTKPLADLSIVDTSRGATCEILAEALLSIEPDIPPDIATALVYGILTDTMNLYRADQMKTFRIYLSLLPFCEIKKLVKLQNPSHSEDFFTYTGMAIQNALICGSLIYCHLGFITDPVMIAHIADYLLKYKKARWSFCTGRNNHTLFVSLRGGNHRTPAYDVLRDIFDQKDHAGGHGTIAGGAVVVGEQPAESTWRKKESMFTKRLLKRLRISDRNKPHYPFRKK